MVIVISTYYLFACSNNHQDHWWDYRTLFRTKADRYRAFSLIMIGSFGQLSGNNLVTYFLPELLGNAGIKDQGKKMALTFINSITSFAGALVVRRARRMFLVHVLMLQLT